MIENNEFRPLVTYALFAYNQEQFIREAVESALAQKYSPLEIILSDDCSTDKTFSIMEVLARKYNGLNNVILNRNSKNLGIIGHINNVLKMANGKFIVMAGGDDISIPSRTDILLTEWIKLQKPACSIFTNAVTINEKGGQTGCYYESPDFSRNIEEFIAKEKCWVGGFSHGFSMELYSKYGPLFEETFQEDGVLSFRALLDSGIHYIEESTVFYRRHSGNSYAIDDYIKFKKLYKSELGLIKGRLIDLKMNPGLSAIQQKKIEKILNRQFIVKLFMLKTPGLVDIIYLVKSLKARLKRHRCISSVKLTDL